jgi:DNA excision repair protein ERCC-3
MAKRKNDNLDYTDESDMTLRLKKSVLNNQIVPDDDGVVTMESILTNYQDLSRSLKLKPDHEKRPIWIANNNIIILEAFSKYYNQAYDFLIDIAEPISRPTYFQTYQLTEDSLYSAVAVSRSTDSIIKYLNILCKTDIPNDVLQFIKLSTSTFGKVLYQLLIIFSIVFLIFILN